MHLDLQPERKRRTGRWLAAVCVAGVAVVAIPTAIVEVAYRVELGRLPRPPAAPRLLAGPVSQTLSLELMGSPTARVAPIWPWHVVGFLALAFTHDLLRPFPATQDALRRVMMSGNTAPKLLLHGIAVSVLHSAGGKTSFFRSFAFEMWMSRHWSGEEVVAAWAESNLLAERARSLFGKDLPALEPGELAGVIALTRVPSARRSPEGWERARENLLGRMHQAGLIDEATRAKGDALPLPSPSPAHQPEVSGH